MAIGNVTKQVGARVRAQNDSMISKLAMERAEHEAAIATIDARITALEAENASLAKDIPAPPVEPIEL